MSGGRAPDIALVICTRDRGARLPDVLARLDLLRPRVACEVVIVDNGSTDETPRVLAEWAAATHLPATIVREPRPGLAVAHNAGVAATRAPVVAFTDDDCYPARDYLDRWVACFAAAPRLGFAAGRVVPYDHDDAPLAIRTDREPFRWRPGTFVAPGNVHGANMAFRREALEAIGGFDPMFGPGGVFNAEDLDATARVLEAGWEGAYAPEPWVYHDHRRRGPRDVSRLMRSYLHGIGGYYASLALRRAIAWRQLAIALRVDFRYNGPMAPLLELAGAAHYLLRRAARAITSPARAASRSASRLPAAGTGTRRTAPPPRSPAR